ncbi:Crotonobetainyl-CoA:carnitine CoA-transferase CaiB [Thermoflavimicrobium dichotomicum]|uniref:Crotonobetainyl-CoA:carnitine CoA-transferase CaiB n=1 Tax=Thermoflavimicrobium dichotomicum TaxID=46223 RepID=A0A1I3SAX2_9BACL|nr:Crotonobetainyl-CoA:carnitine CoA-transferase CaiB [Thermoflavimicrobium dichotomicum]
MLQGIRIIDFSWYLPGPFATQRLVDLGAEVIKVEPPNGDPARQMSAIFHAYNRGKKSVVLDLKQPAGKEAALRLISNSDVLVESFRPGVMVQLGLGYEQVRKTNPDIVYCSITGYGQTGPMSDLASHDLNYMSLSGVLSQFKNDKGRPVHPALTLADLIGGIAASEAIVAALFRRERSGEGAYLDISLTGAIATLMAHYRNHPEGIPFLSDRIVNYAIYETADDRYVSLAALEEKFWTRFCKHAGREDWLHAYFSPTTEENPVYEEVKRWFRSRRLQDWEVWGSEVDCCLTPVLEPEEVWRHPQVKHDLATIGLSSADAHIPELGEHTEALLNQSETVKEQKCENKVNPAGSEGAC